VFKAAQERDLTDKEQLIAVVKEINSASTPEPIRIPRPRCAPSNSYAEPTPSAGAYSTMAFRQRTMNDCYLPM
jgi:hypothetical protein